MTYEWVFLKIHIFPYFTQPYIYMRVYYIITSSLTVIRHLPTVIFSFYIRLIFMEYMEYRNTE